MPDVDDSYSDPVISVWGVIPESEIRIIFMKDRKTTLFEAVQHCSNPATTLRARESPPVNRDAPELVNHCDLVVPTRKNCAGKHTAKRKLGLFQDVNLETTCWVRKVSWRVLSCCRCCLTHACVNLHVLRHERCCN
jgi:hypothetical protein